MKKVFSAIYTDFFNMLEIKQIKRNNNMYFICWVQGSWPYYVIDVLTPQKSWGGASWDLIEDEDFINAI